MAENNQLDHSKELLLEDYKYLRESFWKSEETGETRVKFFITLVTAVFAGLVGLFELKIKKTNEGTTKLVDLFNDEFLFYISIFSLFILLLFGVVTLFRILKRNKATDEYKRGMDEIRQRFKDYYGGDGVLEGYYPLGGKLQCFKKQESRKIRNKDNKNDKKKDDLKLRKFGGLAHSVAVLNSLIFAAITIIMCAKTSTTGCSISARFVYVFFISFLMQFFFVWSYELKYKLEFKKDDYTHAGGIVVFRKEAEPKILLVTAKNKPEEYVLPKGHIEKGEGHGETALREVVEETGIMARLIQPAGTTYFEQDIKREEKKSLQTILSSQVSDYFSSVEKKKQVRTKYYLMEYVENLNKEPGISPENRSIKWLTFDQAIVELHKFPETKPLLIHAKNVLAR